MKRLDERKRCMNDAGLDTSSIETCLKYFQMGEVGCARKKLKEYRTHLLEEIQTKHNQLRCLDYLLASEVNMKYNEEVTS